MPENSHFLCVPLFHGIYLYIYKILLKSRSQHMVRPVANIIRLGGGEESKSFVKAKVNAMPNLH